MTRPTGLLLSVAGCLALLAWFWARGERFIAVNGLTFDEAVHLSAGYGYWTAGEFGLNHEDPPLLKLLWAAPLLFADAPPFPREVASESKLNHWHVADAWAYGSGQSTRPLFAVARRVNLALGCALVVLVGWVAFRVWGSPLAGVAACAFAASDPTLLALSCVLSTDLGVTLFGFLTCYLLWEYSAAPSRGLLAALGVSLGLLLSCKFSAVALVAGMGVAGLRFVWRGGTLALPGKAEAGSGPAVELTLRLGVIATVALAATYAFLHFPEWGKGLKFQLSRGEHGDGMFYLNGGIARGGWFHYFLVALGLKLPLGLLVAASVGAVSLAPRASRRGLLLLVPAVVFFALASYSRVNVGVRAVLPVVPFLYLLAVGLLASDCCRCVRGVLLGACVAWCGVAAHHANPNEIAYFNELAGARQLADSNLDWGQGLPALKQWMDANGIEAVYLGYFGTDRPEAHGIRYQPLPGYGRVGKRGGEATPATASRHVVVVSANHLLGLFLNDSDCYAWLRDRTPTAVLGGTLYAFDLTGDAGAIARVRATPKQ